MPTQTVTRAAESDVEPVDLYEVLAEATNIPKWAPAFADAIERIKDAHYCVTKNGEAFDIEILLHPSAGAVDYIRKMSNGKNGGAYIRVTPRPLGGSTITMTVPVGPNTPESDVAKTLDQELADLIRLASS
jgi:polyketide cyclase/dehydrase/lipid transport protein